MGGYTDFRKQQNIYQVIIPDKAIYYRDLLNIEQSWSGRIDANICNVFILEAVQLLINSLELFEQGYFDCAFYALRASVDVSTTMVFLADMPCDKRENYLMEWKSIKDFPMYSQMINMLKKQGEVFVDMLNKMPEFFDEAKCLSAELNKYVHKQGFQNFYISRNHIVNQKESRESFIREFERYLQRCIGVVAVMRLAIDPFPILLMDKDILYRCFNSLTSPYNEDFANKYIGEKIVESYKQTNIYAGTYSELISKEKKNEAVFDVMKFKCIDSTKLESIFSQLHLLEEYDKVCVLLVAASEKVVKIYFDNALMVYFTNRNTNRKAMRWSGEDFAEFARAEKRINQIYDEAYISVFSFNEKMYFVEHNERLSLSEAEYINSYVINQLKQ